MHDSKIKTLSDREYVIEFLQLNALFNGILTEQQEWEAYCKCDGYGDLEPVALTKINGGYDWSHVRDSSEAGFARARVYIEVQLQPSRRK